MLLLRQCISVLKLEFFSDCHSNLHLGVPNERNLILQFYRPVTRLEAPKLHINKHLTGGFVRKMFY
jgi:hypothetical protein